MIKKYDVIVIGAGIGGLMCGTKLAKKGLNVLIVEKHDKPGGCVTACTKHGYNFDYGAHIFGSCNKTGILNYYLRGLAVRNINFIRLKPTERFVFPDQTIEIPQDLDEYIDYLKSKYSKDAKNIDIFFKVVQKIARSFSSDKLLARYAGLTYEKLMKAYFKNEKLMSVLSGQFRCLCSAPSNLAATSMCLMMMSYIKDGTYYPEGGTQVFSNSIAEKFMEYRGSLLLKNEVTKIITNNKRVSAVKTKNGDVYESNIIVSNADAIKTFFNLVDRKEIDRAYLKKINSMKIGSSFFMLFLGIKDTVDLRNKSGWYHFSYGLNLKPEQSLYIFIPSLIDSSRAPKNRHVLELAIPFPHDFESISDWSHLRKELRNKVLSNAEKIIPGLRSAIEFEEIASPSTIERYTYNSHGSACGWEMSINYVQKRRLPYDVPIEGMFIAGHWTNPGCGVAPVATSGWVVADKVLKVFDKKKPAVLV